MTEERKKFAEKLISYLRYTFSNLQDGVTTIKKNQDVQDVQYKMSIDIYFRGSNSTQEKHYGKMIITNSRIMLEAMPLGERNFINWFSPAIISYLNQGPDFSYQYIIGQTPHSTIEWESYSDKPSIDRRRVELNEGSQFADVERLTLPAFCYMYKYNRLGNVSGLSEYQIKQFIEYLQGLSTCYDYENPQHQMYLNQISYDIEALIENLRQYCPDIPPRTSKNGCLANTPEFIAWWGMVGNISNQYPNKDQDFNR